MKDWMNKPLSNFIACCVLGIAFVAAAQAPANSSDTVIFRNGDLLYGHLLSIDASGAVKWQHPDASEPIEFKPNSASQIDFPEVKNPGATPTNACRLLLANGDCLEGGLLSCDRDGLALQTWYAGRVTVPRAALKSLVFIRPSAAVFDGITGLDGWTRAASPAAALGGDSGDWTYHNGAFYADRTASIARDFHLPNDSQIQFDLAWKGSLNLAVALYTDSLRPVLLTEKDRAPDFGGFYSFRFQNSVLIDVLAIKKQEPIRALGQVMDATLGGKDRVHVDLRVSKAQHEIALFLDKTLVKEWIDTNGFIGQGSALRFVQNPGGMIKLSNLRITHWDGLFDQPGDETEDVVWLNDGRKISGTITSLASDKITVKSVDGLSTQAFNQVRALTFAHREPAEPPAGTMRATFSQGGNLTFTLDSWQPGEMIVESPDFGHAQINPAAFTRLQFLAPEKKSSEEQKAGAQFE